MTRKMATVRRIDKIEPIEGADKIVKATVGGWQLVTAIDNGFKEGDLVVYCEIDSWIPTQVAPFLSKGKEPREYNGVKGEKLRTIKLRGQISQGLLLPMDVIPNKLGVTYYPPDAYEEGTDVSELLGIQKYEPPIPAQLAGLVKGNFPSQIPKTDQERIQNIKAEIKAALEAGLTFEITEKLEGSSMTCYLIQGEFGVCSRNMDLKRDENNTFWKVAIDEDVEAKMRRIDEHWDFAIQGELVGPGVQGNIYKLQEHVFAVFDVYDIMTGKYLNPKARRELIDLMGLYHVPVLAMDKDLGTGEVDYILEWAEGKSALYGTEREGIVFKEMNGGMTFKAISNKYLIGQKD